MNYWELNYATAKQVMQTLVVEMMDLEGPGRELRARLYSIERGVSAKRAVNHFS